MNEIKLSVNDENLETVLIILENLKTGLIENVDTGAKMKNSRRTSLYKPKINTIIREENSATADKSGKYISVTAYKERLKKRE